MMKRIALLLLASCPVATSAQGIIKNPRALRPTVGARRVYVPPTTTVSTRVATQAQRAVAAATAAAARQPVAAQASQASPTVRSASRTGYLYAGIPLGFLMRDEAAVTSPRRNLLNKRYPSGLRDEEQLINDWLEYFRNGYFQPRDQVEAIEGMTPRQMNNIIEYLYYMPMEEAKEIILNPLRDTGRLPDFMYEDKLIPGTQRLPAGYYKNKFNQNVATFVKLAEEDGTIFTHNAQLKELMSAMKDYNFRQGFSYTNSPELTSGLRRNWEALYAEISKPGINTANRAYINQLWNQPVQLLGGKTVSLKEYFTQTRKTKFDKAAVPEFYLNSPKWVALENERRNLIARDYPFEPEEANAFNKLQKRLVLGNPDAYLTMEQFGQMMTGLYQKTHGKDRLSALEEMNLLEQQNALAGVSSLLPSSTKIRINNFEKIGGVCQMAFTDGGYMGRVEPGYDGTSLVDRYEPVVFDRVRAITFDMQTLQPRLVTLDKVSYVKDLKEPDIEKVRASSMVGDGLDESRDVLTVERTEKALRNIRHLKATVYPVGRVHDPTQVPYMRGGGLAGYLALFTPDFYPVKTVNLWRNVDGKLTKVPTHFVRKEVLTLAGFVHRDFLTFTEQVEDRIVEE